MKKEFDIIKNECEKSQESIAFLSLDTATKIREYHKSFSIYQETPLRQLDNLASDLGVKKVFVKDESYRFKLNAFKVLGGSYALGRVIAKKAGIDLDDISFKRLQQAQNELKDLTFISATDGNHGRGLAWSANKLGFKSVIYMPKGSAIERRDNIRAENSECIITDLNYDDTVRLASAKAQENNWILVQDTSWPGYTEIPTWIMQGYTTLGSEIYEQLSETDIPTHIFLQAGVGAMAGALCGFFRNVYQNTPKIIVVEPNTVDCIFKTAQANDGEIHSVTGDLNTIMAGLACGEPCPIGWYVLRDYANYFITCPDYAAADGMRVLANPMNCDSKIISGESGASSLGAVVNIIKDQQLNSIKEQLEIDENSKLLFINTEGDTDKENYQNIVWYGKYSK